ncbi:9684_t:CDS:2, partial [Dentiscutata erythropus]
DEINEILEEYQLPILGKPSSLVTQPDILIVEISKLEREYLDNNEEISTYRSTKIYRDKAQAMFQVGHCRLDKMNMTINKTINEAEDNHKRSISIEPSDIEIEPEELIEDKSIICNIVKQDNNSKEIDKLNIYPVQQNYPPKSFTLYNLDSDKTTLVHKPKNHEVILDLNNSTKVLDKPSKSIEEPLESNNSKLDKIEKFSIRSDENIKQDSTNDSNCFHYQNNVSKTCKNEHKNTLNQETNHKKDLDNLRSSKSIQYISNECYNSEDCDTTNIKELVTCKFTQSKEKFDQTNNIELITSDQEYLSTSSDRILNSPIRLPNSW